MGSGYAPCACPDCDGQVVVVDDDSVKNETEFCAYCEEAGCDCEGGEYLCRDMDDEHDDEKEDVAKGT